MLLCCVLHLLTLNHGQLDTTGVKNNLHGVGMSGGRMGN